MVIDQGDVWWADLSDPSGAGPDYRRPVVVVQNNLFNHSRIATVLVCAITSNVARAKAPGNVLLADKEAGLTKRSVVNVSQTFTLAKTDLLERVGTLSARRVRQIIEGIKLLLEPADVD